MGLSTRSSIATIWLCTQQPKGGILMCSSGCWRKVGTVRTSECVHTPQGEVMCRCGVGTRTWLSVGEETCAAAAEGGHLHVIKWLTARGCALGSTTCLNAASEGNLDILQWALDNGCKWDDRFCIAAAETGQTNVLQWIHARDPDLM